MVKRLKCVTVAMSWRFGQASVVASRTHVSLSASPWNTDNVRASACVEPVGSADAIVVPVEVKIKLEPYARRTWKRSPAAPVQVSCTPVVVDVELRVKPGVGGPRAPAAPTSNVSSCCAVRPEASVAMTRKSYLPATRPVVLSDVVHVTRPAAPSPGPPGIEGEVGLDGSMLRVEVQIPLPTSANADAIDARPGCVGN